MDSTSADPGIAGIRLIPMDDDHATICKPKNKDAQVYRGAKKLVQQIASQLKGEIANGVGVEGFLLKHAATFSSIPIKENVSNYLKSLIDECSHMQILGMEQPIPLDDIYTEVRIVNRVKARRFKTIDELHEEAKQEVRRREYEKLLNAYIESKKVQAINESIKKILAEEKKKFDEQYIDADTQLKLNLQAAKIQIPENIEPRIFVSNKVEHLIRELSQLHAKYKKLRESIEENDQAKREQLKKDKEAHKISGEQYDKEVNKIKNEKQAKQNKLRVEEAALADPLEEELKPINDIYEEYQGVRRNITKIRHAQLNKKKKESQNLQLQEEILRSIEKDAKREAEEELERQVKNELTKIVFNDFGHSSGAVGEAKPAWDAVLSINRALILGQPGAGKTTFLKHVALMHATDRAKTLRFPIYIVLRRLIFEKDNNLLSFIANDFKGFGFEQPHELLEHLLKDRECLLIFDGLDEVSTDEQERIVSEIVSISRRYRQNKIFVSCRTANYRGQLEGFSEFEVCEFSKEQIKQFVTGWFKSTPSLAYQFLKDLNKNPGLQELASTPLLAALLCIGYKRNQNFPTQMALVYLNSIDALLIDWDYSKQVKRTNYVSHFDAESKKQLLGKVACDTFCEEKLFFQKQEIIDILNKASLLFPAIEGNQGQAILNEYVLNHGLLIERAKNIFSFSHLTIQEFLAAFYLSRVQNEEIFKRLASESFSDPRWNEVVVFLGGLLTRADILLVCLRNKMKEAMLNAWFKDYFIGGALPQPIVEFIKSYDDPDVQKGWEAWFRWRYFEYKIHEASYGNGIVGILGKIQSLEICKNIAKAAKLDTLINHDLDKDKPANKAFRKAVEKASGRMRIENGEDSLRYANLANNVVQILSAGAKIEPELKWKLLIDIGSNNVTQWMMPNVPNSNILGA